MNIDFTTPMTFYELLAIILAALALIFPCLKWVYDKYIKRLKFDFLPSGNISIFFNKSGSYISLGGVYDAKNKNVAVKNISAKVTRLSDKAVLSLGWSSFESPVFRRIANNYETTFETAHPFKVEADMLTPVFVEFTNSEENSGEIIAGILKPIHMKANSDLNTSNTTVQTYDPLFRASAEYKKALLEMNDLFFWKQGNYRIELITEYNDSTFICYSNFTLSKEDSEKLRANIEEMFVEPLANRVNCRITINTVRKKFELDNTSAK